MVEQLDATGVEQGQKVAVEVALRPGAIARTRSHARRTEHEAIRRRICRQLSSPRHNGAQCGALRHRLLRIERRPTFEQRVENADGVAAEMADRQSQRVRDAARWITESGIGHAWLRRQLVTIPHGHGVDRLARDKVGQVGRGTRRRIPPARFPDRSSYASSIIRLSIARVHLRVLAFHTRTRASSLDRSAGDRRCKARPACDRARRHQQHGARDARQARPQRAQNFDIGIERRLVADAKTRPRRQHRRIAVAARAAKARRGDLDVNPVAQLDRLGCHAGRSAAPASAPPSITQSQTGRSPAPAPCRPPAPRSSPPRRPLSAAIVPEAAK